MTRPEQSGFDAAAPEDLEYLYRVGSIACIRHGEWFDPKMPEIIEEPEMPYPGGPFFEMSHTGTDIELDAERSNSKNLQQLAQKWQIGRLTIQYMSQHRRKHGLLPLVETIPGALSFLVERTDKTEDTFILENRLVDGAWQKITDRLNNRSPIDFFQDRHTDFSFEEAEELAYFAVHIGRIAHTSK